MNFASLLKQHQHHRKDNNLHTHPHLTKNQFTINCKNNNRLQETLQQEQQFIVAGGPGHTFRNSNQKMNFIHQLNNQLGSGLKRKNMEMSKCVRLLEVYESFQEDQTTQWILEIENSKVKLHKFKPSKICKNNKKNQGGQRQNLYLNSGHSNKLQSGQKYIQPNHNVHPKFNHKALQQLHPNSINPIHPIHPQISSNPSVQQPQPQKRNLNIQRQRKNYSPMNKLRPKTFLKKQQEQNWMKKILSQNKFSFGDDVLLENYQNKNNQIQNQGTEENHQNYQNHQNQKYNQNQKLTENTNFQHRQLQNTQRQRNYYIQTQNHNNSNLANTIHNVGGINLIKQFQKCQQKLNGNLNGNNHHVESQSNNSNKEVKVKCSQANPSSDLDFNLDSGFSFQQIDKIGKKEKVVKQQQFRSNPILKLGYNSNKIIQNKPQPQPQHQQQITSANNNQITQSNVIDLSKVNPYYNFTQPHYQINKNQNQNHLNNNNFTHQLVKIQKLGYSSRQQKQQIKPQPLAKQNQSSSSTTPNRIYCKVNVRNLTPQKFKYPRLDQKSNTLNQIQNSNTPQRRKVDSINKNVNNQQQSQKNLTSSKKLQALIQQSNKLLLEHKEKCTMINAGTKQEPADRIRRIVLHQPSWVNNQEKKQIIKQVKSQIKDMKSQEREVKEERSLSIQKHIQQRNQTETNNMIRGLSPNKIDSQKKLQNKQHQVNNLSPAARSRSPIQQKPIFANQLANLQTNYNALNPFNPLNPNPNNSKIQKIQTHINQSPINLQSKNNNNNYIRYTQAVNMTTSPKNNQDHLSGNKRNTIGGQNEPLRVQSNYAYKPLGLPPHIVQGQGQGQGEPNANTNGVRIQADRKIVNANGNGQYNMQYHATTVQNIKKMEFSNTSSNNQVNHVRPSQNVRTYSPYYQVVNFQQNSGARITNYQPYSNNPSIPNTQNTQTVHNVQNVQTIQIDQQSNSSGNGTTSSNFPSIPSLKSVPSNQILHQVPNANYQTINNNYIRITSNYISPLQKHEQKQKLPSIQNLGYINQSPYSQPYLKPNAFYIQDLGVKCTQSKIYDPTNKLNNISQPKQSSIQFSLQIDENFSLLDKNRIY